MVGARNFKFGALMPNASRLTVTINRLNRNRMYNSNMADVRFLNSEVVITQPWIALFLSNLVLR